MNYELTLIKLLENHTKEKGDEVLYSFLKDGENEEESLTYRQLRDQAKNVAAKLSKHAKPGERALMLFPAGLDFIRAFFGCLYAGLIAVPAYPPRNNRNVPRIRAIASDAQAALCLTNTSVIGRTRELVGLVPGLESMEWIAVDSMVEDPGEWEGPQVVPDSLAFLQYTSGSTGTPKGVMVSHSNVVHNTHFLSTGLGHTGIVSWLPLFHDMGLIYGALQPLYGGFPSLLMAPAAFLQRPVRWLKALSRTGWSTAIAPNFAYDLCVEKVTEQEKQELDLSHWVHAFNSSEPIRAASMTNFAAAFECCGFRQTYLKTGYGLAESTLGITLTPPQEVFRAKRLSKSELALGKVVEVPPSDSQSQIIVGCGQRDPQQEIRVVDPETCRACEPGRIGEIWMRGPSKAQGYWNLPEETEAIFEAEVQGEGAQGYLRTGDLGFMEDNEVYLTGRHKDLIILRGLNYYPQDIESVVEQSHEVLRKGGHGAAFSIEYAGQERLVVIQELSRHHHADLNEVIASIRENVSEVFGLWPYAVALVRINTIHKTSSGKIQRRSCRQAFLEGDLQVIAEWRDSIETSSYDEEAGEEVQEDVSSQKAKEWIVNTLAKLLHVTPGELALDKPLARYGLDSVGAVSFVVELERYLQRTLPESLLFDYPSIDRLMEHLFPQKKAEGGRGVSFQQGQGRIAIIGMGLRFPQADHPEAFWKLLAEGRSGIRTVPSSRWPHQEGLEPKVLQGGFLNQVEDFEAEFFELSPREVASMDPQQRLLLEVSWHALEEAGIDPGSLRGSLTGVYIGLSALDHSLAALQNRENLSGHSATGLSHAIAANRLSYFYDWRGPSLAIDTACSSSLVALHYAKESLLRGECDLALAGGVNLILTPEITVSLSRAGMLAQDGLCKTFDSRADGYVRGEGCGLLVLKRLEEAEADGDQIHGVLVGSAVNQDGKSNGLTAPNGPAQEAVIRKALRQAGVSPAEVEYVECHGTGTPLGDPQEVEALDRVQNQPRTTPCVLGALKANSGHLEAAAGVAGVIKVLLCLEKGEIPKQIHLEEINPRLASYQEKFLIPRSPYSWTRKKRPRLAGVSSFGFGGTNAHVLVEEWESSCPDLEEKSLTQAPQLLCLSARTEQALRHFAGNLSQAFYAMDFQDFVRAAATLHRSRSSFPHRLVVVARHPEEAAQAFYRWAMNSEAFSQPLVLAEGLDTKEIQPLLELARHYLKGETIKIPSLESTKLRPLSLPGYPFKRESYACTHSSSSRSSSFSPWEVALAAGAKQAEEGLAKEKLQEELTKQEALNQLSLAYVHHALTKVGLFQMASTPFSLEEVIHHLNLTPLVKKNVGIWLKSFVNRGLLQEIEGKFLSTSSSAPPDLAPLLRKAQALWVQEPEVLHLVQRVGETFDEILQGKVQTLDLLFGEKEGRDLEMLYQRSQSALYYNGILAHAFEAILRSWPQDQPLKILEIGAGTGGTTAHLLPKAHHRLLTYTFTDLGKGFLVAAQKKWGACYPFLSFDVLDIEQSPQAQGYSQGEYALVLASNVLHATKNLRQTLNNVEELLAPGGLLLVWEATVLQQWFSLAFGTLEGWQRYEDDVDRTQGPLLSPEGWQQLLHEVGFQQVAALPPSGSFAESWGQAVLLAQRDAMLLTCSSEQETPRQALATSSLQPAFFSDSFYEIQWESLPSLPRSLSKEKEPCLLLTSSHEAAQAWSQVLKPQGKEDVVCLSLEAFMQEPPEARLSALMASLVEKEVLQEGKPQPTVQLLLSLGVDPQNPGFSSTPTSTETLMAQYYEPLSKFIQFLHCQFQQVSFSLWVLTQGARLVLPEEASRLRPDQAFLAGVAQSLAYESPEWWGGLVDFDPLLPAREQSRLLFDFLLESHPVDMAAFRQGSIWAAHLAPVTAPVAEKPLVFQPDAAYVITGGYGGIGLCLARWLAAQGVRHLILNGRRSLPARDQWDGLIEQKAPQASCLQTLVAIESQGVHLTHAAFNLADVNSFQSFLEKNGKDFPPIRGVFHAAGVVAPTPWKEKPSDIIPEILHPKVEGTLQWASLLPSLDFFVGFSSAAAVFGSAYASAYCGANAFMESWNFCMKSLGHHTLCISWGSWINIGMMSEPFLKKQLKMAGVVPLSEESCLQALEKLMTNSTKNSHIIFSEVDWQQHFKIYPSREKSSFLKNITVFNSKKQDEFFLQKENCIESKNLEKQIQTIFSEVLMLKRKKLEMEQPLAQLGFDSIMAIQLANELQSHFGVEVHIKDFEKLTLSKLVDQVLMQLIGKI